jgi:hypothetical protein
VLLEYISIDLAHMIFLILKDRSNSFFLLLHIIVECMNDMPGNLGVRRMIDDASPRRFRQNTERDRH